MSLRSRLLLIPRKYYNFFMTKTKFGTFEDLMAMTVPDMQPIAARMREIVFEIDPDAVEVVRLGDRAATYGLGPKKMSEGYAYILPHQNWVNLGFYKGADLPDPTGILEGTGKKLRHIKVRSIKDAERREVRALIEEALAERRQSLERSA
jgi:hypothetical protein